MVQKMMKFGKALSNSAWLHCHTTTEWKQHIKISGTTSELVINSKQKQNAMDV